MRRSAEAVTAALAALEHEQQRRVRRCVTGFTQEASLTHPQLAGHSLVNFCSNDYLGLAREPRLVHAMARAAQAWGVGAGAAHLVTGHTHEHHALEEELAAFTGREAALLFSTGYMANMGVISALTARGEVIVQDRLNHASLIDGARLSDARLLRYRHANAEDAARIACAADGKATLLATDGVFSMDGDIAPLRSLALLAAQHDAWFMVDDAHGLGTLGATGRGALELAGLGANEVPLLVGTLGKAFGSFGAFVAGSRDVVDLILQRARSYIYTTALPPPIAAATRAALAIVSTESWHRERLQALIARFRAGAIQLGLPLMSSQTAIQPIILAGNARCLTASRALAERGYWVAAIRSPTVPAGTERLRITLSAAQTEQEVDGLLDALRAVLGAADAVA